MPQLGAVVGADVQNRLSRRVAEKTIVDFPGDGGEMHVQRTRHPGKVSVIAEHRLLGNRVVQLRRLALAAIDDPQGIERLLPNLVRGKEMIAPGMVAQIDGQLEVGRITNAADHSLRPFRQGERFQKLCSH